MGFASEALPLCEIPSEGAGLPEWTSVWGWSDHWSYARRGVPALMLTDTAPFRYPRYHRADDLPQGLDYDTLAKVVEALVPTVLELAR